VTLSHLLDPNQGICHHLVLDPLQGDAQGHDGDNHQHLHHAVVTRQLYHHNFHQNLPRRERQGGLFAGGHRAASPTTCPGTGRQKEHEIAPARRPSLKDTRLAKPGRAHPPSTDYDYVLNLDHPPDGTAKPGSPGGCRDLPEGSAAPPSSPSLSGTPGKELELKLKLECKKSEMNQPQLSEKLPGRSSSISPGRRRSSSSSGRSRKKEELLEHLEEKEGCQVRKKEEENMKKNETYLLVPEPGASPGTSVPASSISVTTSAATSSLIGAITGTFTPGGRRGRGERGTDSQGKFSFKNINENLYEKTSCQTAAYICTGTLLPFLNLTSGKTTALTELTLADQWEDRESCNLQTEASLARNITPATDATPGGLQQEQKSTLRK
jgi:hypothetical protein